MRIEAQTIAHLQEWLGKTESLSDTVTAAPVRALSATLDRLDPEPSKGSFLPELWHWLYFLPHARQSEIGADGHPQRGGPALHVHAAAHPRLQVRPAHLRAGAQL